MPGHSVRPGVKAHILRRDGWTCRYCWEPGDTIDHVIPWSVCRSSRQENLAVACLECNELAADLVFDGFEEKRDWIRAARDLPPVQKWEPRPSGLTLADRFPGLAGLLDQTA